MQSMSGNVFVTGGSGFLARGLMRRAQREGWDCQFTCFSRGEEAQRLAKQKYKARYLLGDITDFPRLKLAMLGHDTVVHTAALKYIPEGEANPSECVRINIDGSRTVMDAAREAGVKRVICISTDKAPQPVNTYGMTKAVVERLVQETFSMSVDVSGIRFVACRYGNVVGSTGSIWPVWKRQAEEDHEIKLTDPRMTRYMMSVDQAIDTILAAYGSSVSGVVLLPFPGAVRMGALADEVAKHLGVPKRVIGPRPGEKLHEQMISTAELDRLVDHADRHLVLLPPTTRVPVEAQPVDANMLLSSHVPPCWHDGEWFIQTALDSESV